MRRELLDGLDAVPHASFLCYLLGPAEPPRTPGFARQATSGSRDLLREVRDRLRSGPGVNAFLGDDAALDCPDPATRSVRLARASNAVAVVAPDRAVDARTAAVLDDACAADRVARVALAHEAEPGSAPSPLAGRRSVAVYSYGDVDELAFHLRTFVLDVMHREARGDLSPLPG